MTRDKQYHPITSNVHKFFCCNFENAGRQIEIMYQLIVYRKKTAILCVYLSIRSHSNYTFHFTKNIKWVIYEAILSKTLPMIFYTIK